jgi:hypothetical protein
VPSGDRCQEAAERRSEPLLQVRLVGDETGGGIGFVAVDAGGDELDPADVHHRNPGCTVDELAVDLGPEDPGGAGFLASRPAVAWIERSSCGSQNQRWFDLATGEQAALKKSPVPPFAIPPGISWIVFASCG